MFELKKYESLITNVGLVLFWVANFVFMWTMPIFLNGLYIQQNFTFDLGLCGSIFGAYSFIIWPLLPFLIVCLIGIDVLMYLTRNRGFAGV